MADHGRVDRLHASVALRHALVAALAAACLAACAPQPAPAEAEDLVDEAAARGLDYVNLSGAPEKPFILDANGAGCALLDLGGDGDLDLVVAQGLARLADVVTGPGADLALYENDGAGHFRRLAGPGLSGWWTGLAVGDLDNDGDDDLVAAGFGDVAVLLQEHGALVSSKQDSARPPPARRLAPGATRAADAQPPAWATSLALFDADRDGNLDLYVAQYLDLDPLRPPSGALGKPPLDIPCEWKGAPVYCGPLGLVPQADRLLLGRGDGGFVEASERLQGLAPCFGLGVHAFDADGDRDDDIYVANDSQPNNLWLNDGAGRFVDAAHAFGVAYGAEGRAQAGMGVASGDVDRDGKLDFVVTNFSDEPTELYGGAARGFARWTHRWALGRETRALLSWGCHLVDFDGDGWLELVTINGHVYPQADLPDTGTSYGQPARRWALGPEPRAVALPPRSPASIFAPALGGRGSAVGDLDGDGRPDLVVVRIDGPIAAGMNRLERRQARLSVRLLGPDTRESGAAHRTPRDGSGAKCVVVVEDAQGEHALLAETRRAVGYQSSSTPWLHYGLGAARNYEKLIVLWPSGAVQELPGGPADRELVVREGVGVVATREFRR